MKKLKTHLERFQQYAPEISVVIIALMLRLPLLGGSFWLDESAQALESARPLSEQLNIIPDFQPPLLHLITHFALYVSSAEWWLRTTGALIPGLITIWATFKIGKKMLGELGGSIAALLLATNSFHIYYSQELRPYSLSAMFALLGWLILVNWRENRETKSIVLFTIVSALGLYSTYFYPFVLLSQLLYVALFDREMLTNTISAVSIAVLTFVPWLPTFFRQLETGQLVRETIPGWDTVVSIPQLKSIPLTLGKFVYGVIPIDFNLTYVIPTVVILALLSVLILSDYLTRKKIALVYLYILLICFIIPLSVAWVISFVIPVVRPKRLLFLLPIMYLYVSAVVTPFLERKTNSLRGGLGLLFIVVITLINIGSTIQYYSNSNLQRENWRGLYQQMSIEYPPSESVAVYAFSEPFAPMRWYDTQNYPAISLGELHVNQVENLSEKLKGVTDYQYVLVFDYLTDLTDPQREVLATIKDFGYYEVDHLDYPNIGFVRILTRQEVITAQLEDTVQK